MSASINSPTKALQSGWLRIASTTAVHALGHADAGARGDAAMYAEMLCRCFLPWSALAYDDAERRFSIGPFGVIDMRIHTCRAHSHRQSRAFLCGLALSVVRAVSRNPIWLLDTPGRQVRTPLEGSTAKRCASNASWCVEQSGMPLRQSSLPRSALPHM